ncbi:MAG: IS630 family transposase [Microcoleus sp. Co-bin12]|nr:IS630 family transposase [Microcoleus sp. Co-bin12]
MVARQLFPPQQTKQQAALELQHLIAQEPESFGRKGVRWTLASIRESLSWLKSLTLSGVWRHLRRAGLSRKRARQKIHSPDREYLEKLAEIVRLLELAIASNGKIVVLFADEFTFYRQPTLASAYSPARREVQPIGKLSCKSNTKGRIGGVVNALTGEVNYVLASKCGTKQLLKLYQQIQQTYPEAEVIYLGEDNWSVHFHPTVLKAFPEQETRFELKISHYWKDVTGEEWKNEKIPIQILPLPTYASWCNPIEKLWRWLKQEVLHLHRRADQWEQLKKEIKKFLDQFRQKSTELLRYIGLTEHSKLYGEAISLFREKPT